MTDHRVDAKTRWIARIGVWLVRAIGLTWRVGYVNGEVLRSARRERRPVIFTIWHGQLLPLLWTHRHQQVAVIISEHRDGEIIARIAAALGFRLVRGSTSRGAARALLGACKEVEAGFDLAVTLDGPRGPAGVVAPGALVVAQRTGAPMLPTIGTASRGWRLRSWDRFLVPKPFARITVAYGAPLHIEAERPREAAEQVETLRDAMARASAATPAR